MRGTTESVITHPLSAEDAPIAAGFRALVSPSKGARVGIEARGQYDALMEGVLARNDVGFQEGTLGGIRGVWVRPADCSPDAAIVHMHGGWFNFGSARAYRHLAGHIAARAGANAFIPDYRLAPEHPFPAAIEDVLSCYRGLTDAGIRTVALTGDSAGGNLALTVASQVTEKTDLTNTNLVGVAAFSPVTDLTLSGASYVTRADADPLFTRQQVSALVRAYLGDIDPTQALASPLFTRKSNMPPVRIHVGDDEVLLDDSLRYVDSSVAAGVDARVDVWMGMPHGFIGSIGKLAAAAQALDAVGGFLSERFRDTRGRG